MEALQGVELTGTNRSCGLVISLRQTSNFERHTQDSGCELQSAPQPSPLAKDFGPKISGGDFEEATPDPIPNSEVKLFGADGTAREAVWESRTPPGFFPEARDDSLVTGFFHFASGGISESYGAPGSGSAAHVERLRPRSRLRS